MEGVWNVDDGEEFFLLKQLNSNQFIVLRSVAPLCPYVRLNVRLKRLAFFFKLLLFIIRFIFLNFNVGKGSIDCPNKMSNPS